MEPLVSILIPTFNRQEFIGECIESAIRQTYKNLEIVVVDNCSTDDTFKIAKDYASKYGRIHCFQNETNVGPVLNWKKCMDHASGEYAKLLFSDDTISENYIEESIKLFSDQIGLVVSGAYIGTEPKLDDNKEIKYENIDSKTFCRSSLNGKELVSPGAAIFRLADMRKNLVSDNRIHTSVIDDFNKKGAGPDLLLYLITASEYPYVVKVENNLSFFRSSPSSITVSSNNDKEKGLRLLDGYEISRLWFSYHYGFRDRSKSIVYRSYRNWRRAGINISPEQFFDKFIPDDMKGSFDVSSFMCLAQYGLSKIKNIIIKRS